MNETSTGTMAAASNIVSRDQVLRLIAKDFHLSRKAIFWISIGSVLGLILAAMPGQMAMVGITLILNVFIALLFYLPLSSVLGEVTEQTLPFVLSLPVAPTDYTVAKLLSNLLIYLIPWTAVAVGAGIVLRRSPALAQQLPGELVAIVLGIVFVVFCTVLSIAVCSRSTGWTVGLIVVLMVVGGNFISMILPRVPLMRGLFERAVAGGPELAIILGGQLVLALSMLAIAVVRETRRSSFL